MDETNDKPLPMMLPKDLVIRILQTAFDDLEYLLEDLRQMKTCKAFTDEIQGQWQDVDEVLYELQDKK